MKYSDPAIGFAADLVPLVKNGTKTLTYRYGDKYEFLKAGDTIPVKDSSTEQVFGTVEIVRTSFTTFGALPIDDPRHEPYESKEVQRSLFATYYGKVLEDSEKILVLEYKYVPFSLASQPRKE